MKLSRSHVGMPAPPGGRPGPAAGGRRPAGRGAGHVIVSFFTDESLAILSVMFCRPLVSPATSSLAGQERVPDHQLVGVHAVVVDELVVEDVAAGGVQHLRLRDQRGRPEPVGRHQALDDRRRETGLGEVGRGRLRQHRAQDLLAARDVLPWDGTMNGSPAAARSPARQLRAGGDGRLRSAGHLEAGLRRVLHLVLDPAAGRVEDRLLVVAPLRLGGGELGAGAAGDEVALLTPSRRGR